MLSQPEVTALIQREYVPVRMHVRNEAQFGRVAAQFGVQSTPTVLVVDPNGNVQHRLEGFMPKEQFLAHLDPSHGP